MNPMISAVVAVVGAAGVVAAVAGCGADSAESVPTGADLVGTWNQAGVGYEKSGPVTWENQTLVIEEADGQGFVGFKEYTSEDGQPQRESVIGVIGPDGNILIVDEDGRFEGRLSEDTLQGQYSEIGDDPAAMNLEITRE